MSEFEQKLIGYLDSVVLFEVSYMWSLVNLHRLTSIQEESKFVVYFCWLSNFITENKIFLNSLTKLCNLATTGDSIPGHVCGLSLGHFSLHYNQDSLIH